MKDKEIQKMLNLLLQAVNTYQSQNGNPVIALNYFHRERNEQTWCGFYPKGDYVRIVFRDYPHRNDGYYDVDVTATSMSGILDSVWNRIKKYT